MKEQILGLVRELEKHLYSFTDIGPMFNVTTENFMGQLREAIYEDRESAQAALYALNTERDSTAFKILQAVTNSVFYI